MGLQELLKKYDLKAGDEVECIDEAYRVSEGFYIVTPHTGRSSGLGVRCGGILWGGDGGTWRLVKLKEHTFVRSCQPATKEIHDALVALGYKATGGSWVCKGSFIFTNPCGALTYGYSTFDTPCLYDFLTTTTTVATLKPVEVVAKVDNSEKIAEIMEMMEECKVKLEELKREEG